MAIRCGLRRNLGRAIILVGIASVLWGCADFISPTGHYAVTHPWNTGPPISRGTSKAEMLEAWGKPDAIVPLGVDELGIVREEWVYQGKTDLPIDYRYLSRTKRIIFTGDHVTGWEDEAAEEGPTHR